MNEYIEAVKRGDLVEAKKQFTSIMEERKEVIRQELRVELAESVRGEGEEDKEPGEEKDKDGKDKEEGAKPDSKNE